MGIEGPLLLILLVCVASVARGDVDAAPSDDAEANWSFKRSNFPDGFIFGAASSAYQAYLLFDSYTNKIKSNVTLCEDRVHPKEEPVWLPLLYEGAWNVSGKGTSNWDYFTETYPEMVKNNASGQVAVDFYNLYQGDFQLMKQVGFDAVRISFSWARILPSGRENEDPGINRAGLKYYHDLINESLSKGLEPFVTLFHFDIPQALQDEYGGFLNHRIVKDFHDYADLCFREFGNKVKYWITVNEPWSYTSMGFAYGAFPPGRCSKKDKGLENNSGDLFRAGRAFGGGDANSFSTNCPVKGDSGTEPYIVAHNILLAHARAVQLYKRNYQRSSEGKIMGQIGIVNVVQWMVPSDAQSKKDIDAANRALDFMYGWFMEPLNSGSYPSSMIEHVGERLPKFYKAQSEMVKGSFDFIGLNYYTAAYAYDVDCKKIPSYLTDSCSKLSEVNKSGHQIGPKAGSDWLYIYPQGLGDLLLHTKEKYDNPVIYVTENGVDLVDQEHIARDFMRVRYHRDHLHVLSGVMINKLIAVNKVNVKGYFVWSFLDNFEWSEGYTVRFGLVFVNYVNQTLTRFPKDSAIWFKNRLAQ